MNDYDLETRSLRPISYGAREPVLAGPSKMILSGSNYNPVLRDRPSGAPFVLGMVNNGARIRNRERGPRYSMERYHMFHITARFPAVIGD
jgi:hypothetical protein